MDNEIFWVFWKIIVTIILSRDIWSTKLVNRLFWREAFHEGMNVIPLLYLKVIWIKELHLLVRFILFPTFEPKDEFDEYELLDTCLASYRILLI